MTDGSQARIASAKGGQKSTAAGGKGGSAGDGDGAKGGKGKSKKMKLIILLVLVLVGGGAAAKFTVLAPAAKAAEPAKPAPGPVIAMDELTLNLDGGHFLRMKLSLETTKGTSADLETTEGIQAVIDEYSNRTVDSLTGTAAREKAAKELVVRLNKIYPKKILDVFYTEFVMQ